MPPLLSSVQVCRLAGITYRQLNYWVGTGLVRPTRGASGGSGVPMRFSADQVPVVVLAARLMRLGATSPLVAGIVEHWQERPEQEWKGWLVVYRDGRFDVDVPIESAAWVVDLASCRVDVFTAA